MTSGVLHVPFEVKATQDAARPMSFEGYASVFDLVDSHRDTVAPGAFKASLSEWNAKGKLPKMLLQHGGGPFFTSVDDMVPIGKWTEMREDQRGLYAKGYLFDTGTDRVKATYAAMEAGELDGLSIGYKTRKDAAGKSGTRNLLDVHLGEVSIVTFPSNAETLVTRIKSMPEEREFEEWLRRDAGLTRVEAKRVVATCYRRLRDADGSTKSDDIAGRHVEGSHEALIALRSAISGVPSYGTRSQGADR